MTAKSAAERKAEQRERDRMAEEDRLARLLARSIKLDLFKSTDMALIRCMVRAGIDEPQDLITRMIHGADRLDDETLTGSRRSSHADMSRSYKASSMPLSARGHA